MTTPDAQLATMLANVPEKTGKTLAEWKPLIAAGGMAKHGQILKWLKSEHGVTHGFASLIASQYLAADEDTDLIGAQYQGAKAALRPLHDAIVKFASSLGTDVELAPKKTSHSLRRKKQFALITAATKSRIDLGLALKGEPTTERLENGNAMCSHRVRLESRDDLDAEVKKWIKEAYQRAG